MPAAVLVDKHTTRRIGTSSGRNFKRVRTDILVRIATRLVLSCGGGHWSEEVNFCIRGAGDVSLCLGEAESLGAVGLCVSIFDRLLAALGSVLAM